MGVCCFIGHRKIERTKELEDRVFNLVEDLIQNSNVDTFLFGSRSEFNDLCYEIVSFLKEKYPNIPVERIDERFTSKMAFQAMIDGGLKKKQRQNKALIDTVSAVIILQSYMQTVR